MGNSVRSTLGNLCGAEASKDPHEYGEDQKPVAKPKEQKIPKESKKNKKKSKKNKKNKSANGDLTQIEEGDESKSQEPVATAEGGEPKQLSEEIQKNEEQLKTEELVQESTDSQQRSTSLTLKEQASSNDLIDTVERDADNKSEYDNDEDTDDETEEELKFVDEKRDRIAPTGKNGDNDSNGGQSGSDSRGSGMISRSGENNQNLPLYATVSPIVPEEMGIKYVDDIFKSCAEKYQIFVDENQEFKNAVNNFQELVLPGQNNIEWNDALRAYKELLENESKRQGDEAADSAVDISDVNASVQSIRVQLQQLYVTINSVRPPVKGHLSEAADVDVIEYVKGKMVEGEQLGITSKFSAPGKYRRNMKQLKKSLSTLDGVQEEIREIQRSLDVYTDSDASSNDTRLSPLQDNESTIVPVTKTGPQQDTGEDIFARLHELDALQNEEANPPEGDGKEGTYERKLLAQSKENTQEDELKTLLETSNSTPRGVSPDTMTYVIETIPENSTNSAIKEFGPSARQPAKMNLQPNQPKNPVQQIIVEEEEHNTLDFGKYVLVDPNTGDIQVMRNRSRSLDSLVSMTSNRSSLSRFGSFEFVTDFEINIAEKNQSHMV